MAKSGGLDELGDKTIFTDNIGLYLTTATYLARKKSISAKKRKIRAMTPIKVIQGHRDHCNRKPVCDFLLVLIELFSLGVMAEARYERFKIGDFAPTGAGLPKISDRRVASPNHPYSQKLG